MMMKHEIKNNSNTQKASNKLYDLYWGITEDEKIEFLIVFIMACPDKIQDNLHPESATVPVEHP